MSEIAPSAPNDAQIDLEEAISAVGGSTRQRGGCMNVKPILFSGPMVRALIEGRKTQTRRVLTKLQRFGNIRQFGPSDTLGYDWHFRDKRACWNDLRDAELRKALPYAPGDLLYVRETWNIEASGGGSVGGVGTWAYELAYRADNASRELEYEGNFENDPYCRYYDTQRGEWRPSIHMPRWASRLTLKVTGVRVERLQDISEQDARDEGVLRLREAEPARGWFDCVSGDLERGLPTARDSFQSLWDSINEERGFGWEADPWVIAVSFEVIHANVDDVLAPKPAQRMEVAV